MTREEFNKLPKQERVDLVFDKCIILLSTKDNPTRNITYEYARLNEDSEWMLVGERSTQNDFFTKQSESFFQLRIFTLLHHVYTTRKKVLQNIQQGIPNLFILIIQIYQMIFLNL